MGPQHPSTHGVLRLILELDGETVTECRLGIGYLHTGIEKNCEYRTWTQGVTFVTRMDYLAPLYNEYAYVRGVERLLDIEDQVPERANVIRVMMMELNRISSHLVALATGGMELGALTPMTFGFRERELVLDVFEMITGLRMNHAYIRPGGVSQDLPTGAVDKVRDLLKLMPKRLSDMENLLIGNAIWMGRTVGVGYLDLTGCMALGITGPILRATGLPHDLRKSQPYAGYETYEFDVPTETTCDAYGRFLIRIRRDEGVAEDRRAVPRPAAARPGDDRGQEDRLAGAARARRRRARQLPRPHQAHHGPVDGGPDPPLQAGHRGLPGAARPGLLGDRVAARRARRAPRQRRRHPALPGALPRPVVQQPAGRPRRCPRAAWSPTSSRPSPPSTRSWAEWTVEPAHVPGHRLRRRDPDPARGRRRGDRRPLPAGALGAAPAAAPGAVRGGLRQPARHRVLRRRCSTSPPPRSRRSRRSTPSTSAAPTASTRSASAPTRCARSWAATRSSPPSRTTSASATTRRPTTAPITLEHLECNAACDYAPGRDGRTGSSSTTRRPSRPPPWSTGCAPATCPPPPAAPPCARSSRSPGCWPASTTAARTRARPQGPRRWPGCEIYREQQEAEREGKHSASKSATTEKDGDA